MSIVFSVIGLVYASMRYVWYIQDKEEREMMGRNN